MTSSLLGSTPRSPVRRFFPGCRCLAFVLAALTLLAGCASPTDVARTRAPDTGLTGTVADAFTLYDLPTAHSGPRRPDIGSDGTVWIPEFATGKLAAFDPTPETFAEHPLPVPDALPYIVRVADDGVVWVATGAADAVFRYVPAEDHWTVHPLPTRSALMRHMELDASGAAWIAYGNSPAAAPKVARIEVLNGRSR